VTPSSVRVFAAGAALLVLAACGKSSTASLTTSPELIAKATAAGCSSPSKIADAGHDHITPPAKGSYNSDPPTSGSHYNQGAPNGPGFTGVQSAPIQDEIQVHNLEHGHVGIQYDPMKIAADVKATLESVTKAHDTFVFMAPRPGLGAAVTFTSWWHLSPCAHPTNATAMKAYAEGFYATFQDKATESIPGTPAP